MSAPLSAETEYVLRELSRVEAAGDNLKLENTSIRSALTRVDDRVDAIGREQARQAVEQRKQGAMLAAIAEKLGVLP